MDLGPPGFVTNAVDVLNVSFIGRNVIVALWYSIAVMRSFEVSSSCERSSFISEESLYRLRWPRSWFDILNLLGVGLSMLHIYVVLLTRTCREKKLKGSRCFYTA